MNGPKFLILIDVAAKSDAKVFRAAAFANNLLKIFFVEKCVQKSWLQKRQKFALYTEGSQFRNLPKTRALKTAVLASKWQEGFFFRGG